MRWLAPLIRARALDHESVGIGLGGIGLGLGQRVPQRGPHEGAVRCVRADLETAPDQVDPLAHPNQSQVAARSYRHGAGSWDPAAAVGDGEHHLLTELQVDQGARGAGVTYDVAQRLCTMACQTRHQLRPEQTWINVYKMQDADGGTFNMPRPCMMCEDPPCMYICPVSYTHLTLPTNREV